MAPASAPPDRVDVSITGTTRLTTLATVPRTWASTNLSTKILVTPRLVQTMVEPQLVSVVTAYLPAGKPPQVVVQLRGN
jgi:hypothetical protein